RKSTAAQSSPSPSLASIAFPSSDVPKPSLRTRAGGPTRRSSWRSTSPMQRSGAAPAWKASAPLFAALGDETRLRVVSRLCEEGALSIAKLTEGWNVTRQAVTKHLRVLEDVGLVRGSREGRENVWELEPRRLAEARKYLDLISHEWDETLERL